MKPRPVVLHALLLPGQNSDFEILVAFPASDGWVAQGFKLSEWEALDAEAKARALSGNTVFEPNAFN